MLGLGLEVLGFFPSLLSLDTPSSLDRVLSFKLVNHCGCLLEPLLGMFKHRQGTHSLPLVRLLTVLSMEGGGAADQDQPEALKPEASTIAVDQPPTSACPSCGVPWDEETPPVTETEDIVARCARCGKVQVPLPPTTLPTAQKPNFLSRLLGGMSPKKPATFATKSAAEKAAAAEEEALQEALAALKAKVTSRSASPYL